MTMPKQSVVIIGGSITGLSCALALQEEGFEVTLVERDPEPDRSIGWAGSNAWVRRGAPHALQPHVLTAKLRNALHAWRPDLVQALFEAGVWELGFAEMVHPQSRASYEPQPGDEEISVLISRRTTLELAMRRFVTERGIATILDGARVLSLIIESDGPPVTVRGVRIRDGDGERDLLADIVIDASGRTTRFCDELRLAGAKIAEEHQASNSVYYTRHYQLLPGKRFPGLYGLPGAVFPDMTVAAFPADNNAMVITIGAFRDDPLLFGALQDETLFDAICRSVPRVAAWIDPALSRPVSGVMGWANMDFLWRTMAPDGQPQALGFFLAGDTALRSNPKYGRGCTCGVLGARLLAGTLAATDDPAERVRRYEEALRDAFRAEWEELLAVDRSDYERFAAAAGLRKASLKTRLMTKLNALILTRAMLCDPVVQRALLRGFYGLERPSVWTRDIGIWARIVRAAFVRGPRAELVRLYSKRAGRDQIKAWIANPPATPIAA
jgi:2-polyprenyl-6-methoxyphenol hydroxylase-like FAD-dependent oxidoreductase